jgi:hypothetical protein
MDWRWMVWYCTHTPDTRASDRLIPAQGPIVRHGSDPLSP